MEQPSDEVRVPAVASHTLTLVDDTKLWLIGGFSSPEYFNEAVFEYDASDNTWRLITVTGSEPTGLYSEKRSSPKKDEIFVKYLEKRKCSTKLLNADVFLQK